MTDLLSNVSLEKTAGPADVSIEGAAKNPLEDGTGTTSYEVSERAQYRLNYDNGLAEFLSGGYERSVSANEKDASKYLSSGLLWQRRLKQSEWWLTSGLIGGYYSGNSIWRDGDVSGEYNYDGWIGGLQEELKHNRLRIRGGVLFNYSADRDEVSSVDVRARLRDKIRANEVPIAGGLLKLMDVSKVEYELDYRHRFRIGDRDVDNDRLTSQAQLMWEPFDGLFLGVGGAGVWNISEQKFQPIPFASLNIEPAEGVTMSLKLFYGEGMYSSNGSGEK